MLFKFIVDIIRKMPSDIIDFEVVDGLKIKLTSGSSECSLNCLDSSEYPQIDLEEHKTPIYINSMLFKSIVSQTAFAISTLVAFLFTLKVYLPSCNSSLLFSVTTGAIIISSGNITRTPPLIF